MPQWGGMPARFIPARAGNTPPARSCASRGAVHPRSRGEHPRLHAPRASASGSSPLARGTHPRSALDGAPFRFIPARAGNTSPHARSLPSPPVHPRSRGEHVGINLELGLDDGSSPLARGTPAGRAPTRPSDRFIPARAGNTRGARATPAARAVHPRSRGEHASALILLAAATGSSPLARGTRLHPGQGRIESRFIPARAGNTRQRISGLRNSPVHPRSRGEHLMRSSASSRQAGSSPLARGTPRGVA